MNQADQDAEQWMKQHQANQYREWIKATETGTPYFINQNGDVVAEKDKPSEN